MTMVKPRTFGIALFCVVMLSVLGGPAPAQSQVPQSQAEIDLSFAPLVREAAPAVVNIYASKRVVERPGPFFDDPFFRRFFGDAFPTFPGRERMQRSLGSGVIIRADGLIVTNAHVIDQADDIRVVLNDRREFDAEMVVVDARTDLAVLRIDAPEPLPVLTLGDSDALQVGDLVLAIGNPFGVGQTVTSGIVSALARTGVGITDFNFFIQTDAAINPGNSGGALIDVRGRLIGINTAIYSRDGGSSGIGFAVPADMVRTVIAAAETGGPVMRPWIGAGGQAVDRDLAEALGLDRPVGVLINEVFPDGPADRAGMRRGDVVLSVAGRDVADPEALRFRFATQAIGEAVPVTIQRNRQRQSLSIIATVPPEVPPRNETLLDGAHPLAGAVVANLSPALVSELGEALPYDGVVIVDLRGGPAARFRLRRGDVIREINGRAVTSVAELLQQVETRQSSWQLLLERDGRPINLTVRG